MSLNHGASNTVGFALFVGGTLASAVSALQAWILDPAPMAGTSDPKTAVLATLGVAVVGLLTQIVQGIFSGRKLKREVLEQMEEAKRDREAAKAEAARDVADARAEAARQVADAKAEAARQLADQKAENERQHAKAQQEAEAMAYRRKTEREFQNLTILELTKEVRALKGVEPRVLRNEEAIDVLAQSTHTPVPPTPAAPEA